MSAEEIRVANNPIDKERAQRRTLMLLWGTLFSLVVADGVITDFVVSQRLAWESNPFLADWVGENGFLALKALGSLLAILILRDISRRHYRVALTVTCFFVFLYTLVVFWNVLVYFLGS
ncbi:DUF5658 family protein [Chloroflexota bacterium]